NDKQEQDRSCASNHRCGAFSRRIPVLCTHKGHLVNDGAKLALPLAEPTGTCCTLRATTAHSKPYNGFRLITRWNLRPFSRRVQADSRGVTGDSRPRRCRGG